MNDAKTAAEEFAKLQEAARKDRDRPVALSFGTAEIVLLDTATTTALPRLTLEVVAENERLRELVASMWKPINERRVHLIWRGTIARDLTATEREELEQWQALASLMQNTLAPLPKSLQEPTR